jgi:hypothetical protein
MRCVPPTPNSHDGSLLCWSVPFTSRLKDPVLTVHDFVRVFLCTQVVDDAQSVVGASYLDEMHAMLAHKVRASGLGDLTRWLFMLGHGATLLRTHACLVAADMQSSPWSKAVCVSVGERAETTHTHTHSHTACP